MVLESIINPGSAEREPWELFFIGVLYSSVAIFLALFVFGDTDLSMVVVFLTVLACAILMFQTLEYEEEKDESSIKEWNLLKEHAKAIRFFVFLFLGFVVSFTLWYVFLPWEVSANVFETQIATIAKINGAFTGRAVESGPFFVILFNNLKVLLFSLFFSFFYGMGAIFILTWNASVIGTAAGLFITKTLNQILESAGAVNAAHYFTVISVGLARYLIHGIPEIAAYFIGGLAGGLISVAIINHIKSPPLFIRVLKDAGMLTLISVGILIVAAGIEVWITPFLF